jgi:hypothetical protein
MISTLIGRHDEDQEENEGEESPQVVRIINRRLPVIHEDHEYAYTLQTQKLQVETEDDDPIMQVLEHELQNLFSERSNLATYCNVITKTRGNEQEPPEDLNISFDDIYEEDDKTVDEGEDTNTEEQVNPSKTGGDNEAACSPNMFSFMENDEQALRKAQSCCPEIGPLMHYLESKELPLDDDHLARKIVIESENHFINDNGILCGYKRNTNKRTGLLRDMSEWKVIPKALRREVLKIVHESTHPGMAKTEAILEDLRYRWPGMHTDVRKYVGSCQNCATGKRGLFMPKNRMDNLEIPSSPFEQLSIDIVGPLTTTPSGHNYILTVQDVFSNFPWIMPLKEQTSREIAEKLMEVFSLSGIPSRIITDLGQNLVSAVIKDVCSLLNITHFKTLAYVHKSNKVERMHRDIGDMLRTVLRDSEIGQWDRYLTTLQMFIRAQSTPNNVFAPAEIIFGKNIRTPTSAQIEAFERQECGSETEYVNDLVKRLKVIREAHVKCRQINNEESKGKVNRNMRPFQVKKDMKVYLRNDVKKQGVSHKLQKEFIGPYEIVEVLSDHSLKLRNLANKKVLKHPVHVDRVKPVIERMEDISEEDPALVEGNAECATASTRDIQDGSSEGDTDVMNPDPTCLQNPPDGGTTPRSILKDTSTKHDNPAAAGDVEAKKQVHFDDNITDDVYEIERIVNVKGTGQNKKYLVKWKDSPTEKFKNTWVAAEDVTQAAIDRFHERRTSSGKTRAAFRKRRKRV